MSLARMALRLAAIEALCPSSALATGGPYLTSAGPRVYDSRIDPIDGDDDLAAIEGKPLIIVFTEEDTKRPYGAPDVKYPVGEQIVDLVVEIMVAVRGTMTIETPTGALETVGTLEAPITDSQHEATLDVLEAIVRALLEKPNRMPSAALFWGVAMEVRSVRSVPQREAEGAVRRAARTVKFQTKIKTDAWCPGAPQGTLPAPLAAVAAAIPPNSANGQLLAAIAASIPAIPGLPLPTSTQMIAIYANVDGTLPTATAAQVEASYAPPDPTPAPINSTP